MTLEGRRVVVTRRREQANQMVALLEGAGAEALVFPCIALEDPVSWDTADSAIAGLARMRRSVAARKAGSTGDVSCEVSGYDWLVFTSANGVERFFARCASLGVQPLTAGLRVAAVGPVTASALVRYCAAPDVLPEEYVGEALLEALAARGVGAGSRLLLIRAEEARDVLPAGLIARGADVDIAPLYRTVAGAGDAYVLGLIRAGDVDAITFTSPSTVRGFVELVGECEFPPAACIGPVASEVARRTGFVVAVQPKEHTVSALVRELDRYFSD